jgi:tetratricopeptide (TPR) repeat protein
LIVAVAPRNHNLALLLKFMRLNRELKSEGGDDQYPGLLAELPPVVLAKAFLQSISGEHELGLWGSARSKAIDQVVRLIGAAVDYKTMITFSRTEQIMLLGALAPPFAIFQLLLQLILRFSLFYAPMLMSWFVLTGRVYDPFHLRRQIIQNAWEWGRMWLKQHPRPSPEFEMKVSEFVNPQLSRLKTMILAQATIHGQLDEVLRGELATLDQRARKSLAQALSELARNSHLLEAKDAGSGSPGLPARLILQTMGDRVLLRGMETYQPRSLDKLIASQQSRPGTIEGARDGLSEEAFDLIEMERVLPLSSRWQSFVITTLLTISGMSLWLALLWLIPVSQFHEFLWPYGVGLSVGFSLWCAVAQHVPRLTTVLGYKLSEESSFSTIRGGIFLALMVYVLVTIWGWAGDAGVPTAGYDYGSDWVSGLFVVTPVLIANLVVPELIARWRGVGLFYPEKARLWFHRAKWSAIAIAGIAFLALAMAYMASGPSHSYRRAMVPYNQAKTLFDNGSYGGAVAALNEAIPLLDDAVGHNTIKNPVNSTAYWMRCVSQQRLGKLEEAIADCTTAIKRAPTASFFLERARLYGMLRQWSQAIADYQEATRRDPKRVGAYIGLAWSELMARQPNQAIQASLSGLKITDDANDRAVLNTNLAHGYLFARQLDMAWSIYRANKDTRIGPNKTYADVVVEDFKEFRVMGIVSEDLESELQKIETYMRAAN